MAYILADEEYRLSRRYGAIFWNYETGEVYAIPERGDDPEESSRKVYRVTEGEETLWLSLADVDGTVPVRCAQFCSGQIGILIEATALGELTLQSLVKWYDGASYSGEMRLWDGICAFARRHDSYEHVYFFQGAGDGNIVRWNTGLPGTPAETGQYLPWRAEAGNVRGLDFDGPDVVPGTWLVAAHESGRVIWLDVSEWGDEQKSMIPYKAFGLAQCRDISDICLDRDNNRLYVLEGGNRLYRYDLEPYGTESSGYHNKPRTVKLTPSARTVSPGSTISIVTELFDLWDQRLTYSGIPVEMISGNGRGRFLEGSEYKFRARGTTGSDGRFTATYKANAS